MNKILELREKRAKAWDAAKAFLDSKRGTDGLISAEDTAVYEKMETDVVNLGKEIDRLERQAALTWSYQNLPTNRHHELIPIVIPWLKKQAEHLMNTEKPSGKPCATKPASMSRMHCRSAPIQ